MRQHLLASTCNNGNPIMSDTSRITLDSLHKGERDRLKSIQNRAEVALARRYPQLKPITVQHLLNDVLLSDARVFHHVVSGSDVEICVADDKAIGALVNELVAGDEIAQRNLSWASAEKRAQLDRDFFASLKVGEALQLERAGLLKARREAFIEDGLRRV